MPRATKIGTVSPFSVRLVAMMEHFGVKQLEIATTLGVSQGTVSAWVNGAVPQPRTAKAIAAMFGVTVEWLLHGVEPKFPPGYPDAVLKTRFSPPTDQPPLSERVTWIQPAGLDARALKQLADQLAAAATALANSAKIIAGAASHRRERATKAKRGS